MKYQGKVPFGDALLTMGSASEEAIQEKSQILIFADINGGISQVVCKG